MDSVQNNTIVYVHVLLQRAIAHASTTMHRHAHTYESSRDTGPGGPVYLDIDVIKHLTIRMCWSIYTDPFACKLPTATCTHLIYIRICRLKYKFKYLFLV